MVHELHYPRFILNSGLFLAAPGVEEVIRRRLAPRLEAAGSSPQVLARRHLWRRQRRTSDSLPTQQRFRRPR